MTFLVDVNLPKSFSGIEGVSCLFVKDIFDEMPDNEVWRLAVDNSYVILTRDKDFYFRAMQSKILPKIVLFRLGNCRGRTLFSYFVSNIDFIKENLINHKLIVYGKMKYKL